MSRLIDLTGKQCGHWTVLGRAHTIRTGRGGTKVYWRCRCVCGEEKDLLGHYLRYGESQSCGCVTHRIPYPEPTEYPREYRIWQSMKTRCANSNVRRYHRYGGRGIKVCEQWASSFKAFLDDMGPCPTLKHSIDRIDNDGDYTPENCRWATNKEQARNSERNRIITFQGASKLSCEWAEELGITRNVIEARIDHYGWSVERALTTPAGIENIRAAATGRTPANAKMIEYNGETHSILEWSVRLGINKDTLYKRINKLGYSVEEAFTMPIRPRK